MKETSIPANSWSVGFLYLYLITVDFFNTYNSKARLANLILHTNQQPTISGMHHAPLVTLKPGAFEAKIQQGNLL